MFGSRRSQIDDKYLAQVFDERSKRIASIEGRMQTLEQTVAKWAEHAETCERLQREAAEARARIEARQEAAKQEAMALKREQRTYTVMIMVAIIGATVAATLEGHLRFAIQ